MGRHSIVIKMTTSIPTVNQTTITTVTKKQQRQRLQKYGSINTSSVNNQLWLLRLPPKLASAFKDVPEGTLLGTLTFTKGAPGLEKNKESICKTSYITAWVLPHKFNVKVSETFTDGTNNLPLDYTLTNLTTQIPTYHPFTRLSDGSITLHGKIKRSCNLQIKRTQCYREMCINRIMDNVACQNKRHVKPVDSTELSIRASIRAREDAERCVGVGTGFGHTIAKFGKKIFDARHDLQNSLVPNQRIRKRKFDENQNTRSILFDLFSHERYWSIKSLKSASGGRSEKDIRSELGSIAEFRRAGEFKGMWELKKEFASQQNCNNR